MHVAVEEAVYGPVTAGTIFLAVGSNVEVDEPAPSCPRKKNMALYETTRNHLRPQNL